MGGVFEDGARPLETILYSPATSIFLLERHHERMQRAAAALGFECATLEQLRARVFEAVGGAGAEVARRVRVVGQPDGSLELSATPLPPPHRAFPGIDPSAPPLRVALDRARVDSTRPDLVFKTTARRLYDGARARVGAGSSVGAEGPFDALLVNERDELTEAGIANVAVEIAPGRPWITPPLNSGLVDGVMRRELLRSGHLVEAVVTVRELLDVAARGACAAAGGGWRPRILCFNAVRGVYEVALDGAAGLDGSPEAHFRSGMSSAARMSSDIG
ncbi:hypothetical protein KFE25_010366 [Diacronema lutheri]|uniref:Uncharacterized protein n=1 Tax=Diacronema lutheri TaxID=2081491 RepID=A0A8J5XBQ5_DIALT|nr:hypothetical protein KFE25_010366 [Diacronema lutheri]